MKRYVVFIFILIMASINLNFILKPLELVAGGTQGVAIILHGLFQLPISFLILIINLLTLVCSYFLLPKQTTLATFIASILYPLFVSVTSFLSYDWVLEYELLFVLIAGITCGITGGYIYKLGFSAGGLSTINLMISQFFKIKVSFVNCFVNGIIILIGWLLFGLKKALYSIFIILISSFIMNFILKRKSVV